MSQDIRFYYDFVSPYSYFAFSQRDEIARRSGRALDLRPVTVGAIMKEVGNVPTSITCKAKRAYLGHDMMRWVRRLQVPLTPHPAFGQFSTAPLVQAALAAGEDRDAFSQAAFEAVWVEQAPIGDVEAMREFFGSRDERFAGYWDRRDETEGELAAANAAAVQDGAFGVPFFHTERGTFFGNDRLDFLYEAIAA